MTDARRTDSDLLRCYGEATRLYPEIRWGVSEFASAYRSESGPERPPSVDDYVRLACLAARPGAAAVFDREHLRPLRGRIFRMCQSAEVTDTVLQKLREELLLPPAPKLAAYKTSGCFRVWLAVVASRHALDALRRTGVQTRREVDLHERLEDLATGPEKLLENEELRQAFRDALRAAVKALPERERQALRLHLVSQWNISQIGRVFSVHRATVARWLVTAKEQLQSHLRQQLVARMGTAAPGNQEIFQELPSRLDVRLSHVFATTGVSNDNMG